MKKQPTMRHPARRLLALCLCAALLLPGAALGETVVASFYPIYLFALNLLDGCEGVEVHELAAPGTGCLHDYQLTTADMKALNRADVFLINGAGMESYLDFALDSFPDLPVVDASAGIELLPSSGSDGDVNAHIWLDCGNAVQMITNLAGGLTEQLPAHADRIRANLEGYTARLNALDAEIREGLGNITRTDIVTFHEAFPYFAKAYGLNVVAVVALEPEESLSARALAELIRKVKDLNNPPLFTEPQYENLAAQTVAAETGAPVYELDPVVTGPEDDIPLDYYEQRMRANLAVLRVALGAE